MSSMRVLCALTLAAGALAAAPTDSGDFIEMGPNIATVHRQGARDDSGQRAPLHPTKRPADDAEAVCEDAIRHEGFEAKHWETLTRYTTKNSGITHIAKQQSVGGLTCSNCLLLCNVDKHGRVINVAYTAHAGQAPQGLPTSTPREALETTMRLWDAEVPAATHHVEKKYRKTRSGKEELYEEVYGATKGLSDFDVTVSLTVLEVEDRKAELAWRVQIQTEDPYYHIYEVWVRATGKPLPLRVIDLVNWDNWGTPSPRAGGALRGPAEAAAPKPLNASAQIGVYEVYPIPALDPTLGNREVKTMEDPNRLASPLGWHDQGDGVTFTTTRGNNNCAQDNPTGSALRTCDGLPGAEPVEGGIELNFEFEFDQSADPTTNPTRQAAITNLFYWHNIVHDIFQLGGFDEPAGNFQENNFGLGGLGNDAVQANAQDGAGFNNANFATPVDGQRPRCRMYLWNGFSPFIDGDFDSGIIVHEIGHGVSNRLTGGPMTSGCLSGGQAGGMGEGWSDWWAVQLMMREEFTPDRAFPMGDYVREGGIRIYPYSYDMDINPATFGYLNNAPYQTSVHAIGSVWCGILHDVFWDMRASFGFNSDWYQVNSPAGNIVLWQNVLDGLKLQPCSPTFIDARDGILLADQENYGGAHICVMWCAFARRGLGISATSTGHTDRNPVEAFDAPPACSCPEAALLRANATAAAHPGRVEGMTEPK